ncbi:MAG: serine hydrolase domain-containing protein [Chthoniobacteraceae bacterium]
MKAENFARIEARFRENFERRGELGASLSVWEHGREVISLAGGYADRKRLKAWTAQTPVLVWSCTKPLAASCILHAMARDQVPLSTPVAEFWPEFAQSGKGRITIGEVLSHQAGLAALDRPAPVLDHAAVVKSIELQVPNWTPGLEHGYHPRTFGSLLEELLRRIEGTPGVTLGRYWQTHFAVPMGLDFWIGLPREKVESVASVFAPKISTPKRNPDFYNALATKGTLTERAFDSPKGLHGPAAMNTAEARMAALPAFGGIGTAHSIAKFYAMLASGGELEGVRYFENIEPMLNVLTNGNDRVLLRPTAFAAGFMHDPVDESGKKLRNLFGPSKQAFGQPGAGGSHAFGDPENGVAFAYVMNQMDVGVMPTEKALGLVEAVYAQ